MTEFGRIYVTVSVKDFLVSVAFTHIRKYSRCPIYHCVGIYC